MSSQANVYTTVSSQTWYTDRALIATGNTAVTYNVALYPGFSNTIYSAATSIPPYKSEYVYVGSGNQLTITGANYTATESGTATSAKYAVQDTGGTLPY